MIRWHPSTCDGAWDLESDDEPGRRGLGETSIGFSNSRYERYVPGRLAASPTLVIRQQGRDIEIRSSSFKVSLSQHELFVNERALLLISS